jgi:drug/metabolite transporter (DMT)-like permease
LQRIFYAIPLQKIYFLNKKVTAHAALIGTNIFFAINFTAVKQLFIGGFILPFGLNLVRVAVTTILLWFLFLLAPQKVSIKREDYWRFVLCALTGITINQLLFVKGLSLTYSIHASLLMLCTPILITLLAGVLLKEKVTSNKLIGLLFGVIGAIALITNRTNSGVASNVVLGDVLVILNAISYTFYFILVKPLMKSYNPVMILRTIFTIGFVTMLPFCYTEFIETNWQSFTLNAWLLLIVVALGGTFFAYLFNIYGIKILGASISGAYIYAQPLLAASIAMIFLNESINATKIVAAILIFLGVYFVNRKTKTDA